MRVFVYYNLHKHLWSVKAMEGPFKGRVVAHLNQLSVQNAVFKVSDAGRRRVIREQRKNVHAGVVGELSVFGTDLAVPVSYNPYKYGYFYDKRDESQVRAAKTVSFNEQLVTADGLS